MTAHRTKKQRSGQGKGPGRSTELTPELTKRICRRIEKDGTSPERAAELEGVDGPAFKEWVSQGKLEGVGLHAELVETIMKADDELIRRRLRQVMTAAANGDTDSFKWLLGRMHTSIRHWVDPVKGMVVEAVPVPNRVRDTERIGRLLQVLLQTGDYDKYIMELGWRRTTDVSIADVDAKQPER